MKRIIDIDEDYFEIIKHNVKSEYGSDFKPFVLIANSIPYEERPQEIATNLQPTCNNLQQRPQIESLIKARNLAEEINERLINEYISKVGCCDECFASIYCTVNGLRESRVPKDYCVKNIKRYFGDKANLLESEGQ